ncbi:MAG: hypothetical protein ABSG38_15530 [Spirochaetia bacterium]|jgi:hypothetical protein
MENPLFAMRVSRNHLWQFLQEKMKNFYNFLKEHHLNAPFFRAASFLSSRFHGSPTIPAISLA